MLIKKNWKKLNKLTVKDEGQLFDIYEFKGKSTEEISKHFKNLVIKAAVVADPN